MTSSTGMENSLGDAEAAGVIAGEELLAQDNVPDKNQRTECFSCDTEFVGLYCHGCGQKNDDYRRSIWSLFSETFASIFSLENRMWRTWLNLLLKPGQVSRDYANGKRTLWTSPVRIYLALSIILFGYMGLTETRIFSIRTDIVPKTGFVGEVSDLEDSAVELKPEFGFFRRQAELDQLNSGTDFERVARLMNGRPRQIFVFKGDLSELNTRPSDESLKSSQFWPDENQGVSEPSNDALRETALKTYAEKFEDVVNQYNDLLYATKNPETIADRIVEGAKQNAPLEIYDEIDFENREIFKDIAREALSYIDESLLELGLTRADIHRLPIQDTTGFRFNMSSDRVNSLQLTDTDILDLSVQVLRNPAILNDGISRYLPRIMFLMMPFAAIFGLIFIRNKKTALLYDHLVHAAYIHAVTFALLLVLLLISQWTSITGLVSAFFLGMAVYLPISTKRMFKRGWFKSFLASYSIAFFYGLTMFIVVTMLTVQSLIHAASIA